MTTTNEMYCTDGLRTTIMIFVVCKKLTVLNLTVINLEKDGKVNLITVFLILHIVGESVYCSETILAVVL